MPAKTIDQACDQHEFQVVLNGDPDLRVKLEEFKRQCESHAKHRRKRVRRRYYTLGLMAKIIHDTSDEEMQGLLQNGARTFHFDTVANKPEELEQLLLRTRNSIGTFEGETPETRVITSFSMEINGDCCRIGRMRNNNAVVLRKGAIITLTTSESYRYSGFKEIAYVINLKYYLKMLKLKDDILIGRDVRGKIVKRFKDRLALFVIDAGVVNSYDYIELPAQCTLKPDVFPSLFMNDLELAERSQVNFIVMPKVRCKAFLKALRNAIRKNFKFKLIGTLDVEYISSRMLDLMGLIKLLDYVWIADLFNVNRCIQSYIFEDVIPIAKCLKKPIIGSVPLERCCDFKRFENHELLFKIDSIFIQKSPWCNKYPLIVRKLLPIKDFEMGTVENFLLLTDVLTSYNSIVHFIIRTICSIECQAILIQTKCESAAAALSRIEIYCPVYVLLPVGDDDKDEECKLNLARGMNLRRNLKPIVFTKEMNLCDYRPTEFGMHYLRKHGLIDTGDFVITLEVCRELDEDVQFGVGDDVVILRAFYIPPLKSCEKFKFA